MYCIVVGDHLFDRVIFFDGKENSFYTCPIHEIDKLDTRYKMLKFTDYHAAIENIEWLSRSMAYSRMKPLALDALAKRLPGKAGA